MATANARFHPLVNAWFEAEYTRPTDVQARSWPVIAAGRHALITAPTGSGKTLTAFMGALDAFAWGRFEPGATRVLYVSPLKALNYDIERNLLAPLAGLRRSFESAGAVYPALRVATRSGDTPSDERQRLLRRPPEFLITTPESLQLLLTTARGRNALSTVETVIVDEIHSIADNRRGVVLAVALERLGAVAGEFQRVALSATVRPLAVVAEFVAGRLANGAPRPIDIVESRAEKRIDFRVAYPASVRSAVDAGEKIWNPLSRAFREVIAGNRSTLFFTNSRRLAEKLCLKINEGTGAPIAYAHHGSLAREIRREVESRLKSGAMRAIVATNSLEMGIDIGALDEVVLIQSPPSIASALQRIGRAGHRVGETSRGTLYPTHGQDFVDAAALAGAIRERDIEPLTPLHNPLDVLAQIIVSMTASEAWHVDDLYALLQRAHPYHRLPRQSFDAVLEMLAGRYTGSRVRDLKPRLALDRLTQTARATKGAVHALYGSGGTIPDRGYFKLRHADSGAAIGELDEEFVWEATVGQLFSLGTQHWQIQRITHNDVLVTPARTAESAPPFWRAEDSGRSFHYSARIGEFLEAAAMRLAGRQGGPALAAELEQRNGFDTEAARRLVEYLEHQQAHTGAPLPHRHHLLIEHIATGPGGYRGPVLERHAVLHTFWGARVNRPLALAMRAAWQERDGTSPEFHADDDAIVFQAHTDLDIERVLIELGPEHLDSLLRRSLESSGFFGARFRECAGRALLLTRQRYGERLPLWISRLHAKKLLTTVKRYPDFPILLETWRTCLSDEFDLVALRSLLAEIACGAIEVRRVDTPTPSPFAANLAWGQIGTAYMYADDTPESDAPSALSDDLIRAAVFDDALRPRLDRSVIDAFVGKRQRTAPGYAPLDADDLGEWLKERLLIDAPAWEQLTAGIGGDGDDTDSVPVVRLVKNGRHWIAHLEVARHIGELLFGHVEPDWPRIGDARDPTDLVGELLSFEGPLTAAEIAGRLPLEHVAIDAILRLLTDDGRIVSGRLRRDEDAVCFCDAENLEILLRMQRAAARPMLEPRPLTGLPGYLAAWQRIGGSAATSDLIETLDRLRGYEAPVGTWLDDILPARHAAIEDHHIDAALSGSSLLWLGRSRESMTFAPAEEIGLIADPVHHAIEADFRDPLARYPFLQLADRSGQGIAAASERLWDAAWSGAVTADTVTPLRRGLIQGFRLPEVAPNATASSLRRRMRQSIQGWPGNWFLTSRAATEDDAGIDDDPLAAFEDAKDRARILLDRYGIVSRELANREGGAFRWSALFRALRVMELAGEAIAGLYIQGLSGPQFARPSALRTLERAAPPAAWWIAANDPISPCGLGIDWPDLPLPARRPGAYLGFEGARLILVAEAFGRRLRFAEGIGDDGWLAATALLTHLLLRRRVIPLERIDDVPPAESPHFVQLADRFTATRDHRGVELTLRLGRG